MVLEIIFIGWAKSGALGKIRTPDLMIRSHVLYPAELPVHSRPIVGHTVLYMNYVLFE